MAYEREMDHFLDMILDPSEKGLITRKDVVLLTRVANACQRSQKEGEMVELEPEPQSSL